MCSCRSTIASRRRSSSRRSSPTSTMLSAGFMATAQKACRLDAARLVVTGGSAGGYLTLMAGVRVKPRPRGLVAYWGYGDVDGEWYTKPSAHYRKQPLVSKEDATSGVGGKVLTGSEPGFDGKARGRYYLYLRQNGLWTREVTGFDAATERAKLDPYCPVRNVTPQYPPTLLIHGTADTDVPYELSANMAKALSRHGVSHELITVEGAGHGLAGSPNSSWTMPTSAGRVSSGRGCKCALKRFTLAKHTRGEPPGLSRRCEHGGDKPRRSQPQCEPL